MNVSFGCISLSPDCSKISFTSWIIITLYTSTQSEVFITFCSLWRLQTRLLERERERKREEGGGKVEKEGRKGREEENHDF